MELARTRQVDRNELIYRIQAAIRKWPKAILKGLADHRHTEQLRARVNGAAIIADDMRKHESLADTPPGPPVRYADFDGGSGVPAQDYVDPPEPIR